MFSGIVQGLGTITGIDNGAEFRRLSIRWDESSCRDIQSLDALEEGSSLAVNGACLTVTEKRQRSIVVELSQRTLDLSNLGQLHLGDQVNLEGSLRMGQSIDGHFLSGHVDGVGSCRFDKIYGEFSRYSLTIPEDLRKFVACNGALAVDGISLTVNELSDEGCWLTIIPYTSEFTTFHQFLRVQEQGNPARDVNLEVDLLARYVERQLHSLLDNSARGASTG